MMIQFEWDWMKSNTLTWIFEWNATSRGTLLALFPFVKRHQLSPRDHCVDLHLYRYQCMWINVLNARERKSHFFPFSRLFSLFYISLDWRGKSKSRHVSRRESLWVIDALQMRKQNMMHEEHESEWRVRECENEQCGHMKIDTHIFTRVYCRVSCFRRELCERLDTQMKSRVKESACYIGVRLQMTQ